MYGREKRLSLPPVTPAHYRASPTQAHGFERCPNPECGWTSDYPASYGRARDNADSWYNYHYNKVP